MFRINEFVSSINEKGVLKNNKYFATITLNNNHYLSNLFDGEDKRLITIRCDSVQLPGISMASADGPPRLGYGPMERHPYAAMFEDIQLTFMTDADSVIHRFFYEWVNVIVNFRGQGADNLIQRSGPGNSSAYEVGYRNRYSALLQIDVFRDDESGEGTPRKTLTYKAFNAYPMAFPSNGLSWGDGDILRLNVPFAYTDYTVDYQ